MSYSLETIKIHLPKEPPSKWNYKDYGSFVSLEEVGLKSLLPKISF